ncbi:MAG: hypothetical protein ACYDH1_18170, partial [Anaerolineaceae bacterium]
NYSFYVNTWVNVTSLVEIEAVENQIELHLATQRQGLELVLTMSLESAGKLTFKLSTCREMISSISKMESTYVSNWKDFQITLQEDPFSFEIKRSGDGMVIKSKQPL